MTPKQENILKELIEKYFEGGNSKNDTSGSLLKSKLDAIKQFVEENF